MSTEPSWEIEEESRTENIEEEREKKRKELEKLRKEALITHKERLKSLRAWIEKKTGSEIRIMWRKYIIDKIEAYIPPPDNVTYAIFDAPMYQWDKRAALVYAHLSPKTSGLPVHVALMLAFEHYHFIGQYEEEIEDILKRVLVGDEVLRGTIASSELLDLGLKNIAICGPLSACPWLIYKHMNGDPRDTFIFFIPPNEPIPRERMRMVRKFVEKLVDLVADEEGEVETKEIYMHRCGRRYSLVPPSISMSMLMSVLEEKKRKAILVKEAFFCNQQLTSVYIPGRNVVFREDKSGIPYMMAPNYARKETVAPIVLHAIYSYVMGKNPSDKGSRFLLRNTVRNTLARVLLEARLITTKIRYPRINTRICRENNIDIEIDHTGVKVVIPVSGEIRYFFDRSGGTEKALPLKRPMKYSGEVVISLATGDNGLLRALGGTGSVLSRITVVDPATGEKFPHPNVGASDKNAYNEYLRTCLGTATNTIERMAMEEDEDLCSYAARVAKVIRDVISKPGIDAYNPYLLDYLRKNKLLEKPRILKW